MGGSAHAVALRSPADLARTRTCLPGSYGAKADGVTYDTKALQAAVDACAAAGGGIVKLESGKFLTDPIVLRSNITLQIESGATLLGSQRIDDYPVIAGEDRRQPLITSDNAVNVKIIGNGTIDGQGQQWWAVHKIDKKAGNPRKPRPWLIDLLKTRNILVEGVTLQNSPEYNLVIRRSTHAVVRKIHILNPPDAANTDGIDPYSSHDILIEDVLIDTGDDDIAIKSGLPEEKGPREVCSDIVIRNSRFLHGHGLSIGSELTGGARNVLVENVAFVGTTNGIRIKSNRGRGNVVENAVYRNITMQNVERPIVITEYYQGGVPENDTAQPVNENTPHFRNFVIDHLSATGSDDAGVVVGLPESKVTDVTFRNVTIHAKTGLVVRNAEVKADHLSVVPAEGAPIIKEEAADIR
jgi:polygalacturonase